MTRGPQPNRAIEEAREVGSQRGTVMDKLYAGEDLVDFTIFCAYVVVFVKVKRSRSNIRDLRDLTAQYRREILRLRKIPQTVVAYRELWVLSPHGSWAYYRIYDEAIVEIRCDGTVITGSREDTAQKTIPLPGPAQVPQEIANRTPSPGTGFICPFMAQARG